METELLKIVVYTPLDAADSVRRALGEAGAGKIGNYDMCSFSTRGIGRFRPNSDANPHIGVANKLEEVEEERIETICPKEKLDDVLKAIKDVHPYEEPAVDIYPLLNLGQI